MKTPTRRTKSGPCIQLISGISNYKTSSRAVISVQNKNQIQAKLQVQKQSTAAASERMLNNKLYVNYERNPFNQLKMRKHKFLNHSSFLSVANKNHNNSIDVGLMRNKKNNVYSNQEPDLMDKLEQLQSFQKPKDQQRISRFAKINDILVQSHKVSNKVMSFIQKDKKNNLKLTDRVPQTKKQVIINKQKIGLTQQQKSSAMQLSIDQIMGMQEINYFFHEGRQKVNIFKCSQQDDILMSPFQKLRQYKFSFDSMVSKISKLSFPILRDLSKIGRDLTTKNLSQSEIKLVSDLLDNSEIIIKEKQIRYIDLMGFSSGRICPQLIFQLNTDGVTRHNNNNYDVSDSSSSQDDAQNIIYLPSNQNRSTFYKGSQQDKIQISQFSQIQLTKNENDYRNQCQKLKARVKKLLQQKQYAIDNRVYDKKIHTNLLQRQSKLFHEYIYSEESGKDTQKRVRKNKIFKNRNQTYKLKLLIDTMKTKNEVDSYILKAMKLNNKKQ